MPNCLGSLANPVLVASHPRSGTHLTIDTLRKQFLACASWKYPGEPLDRLYVPLEGLIAKRKGIPLQTAITILGRSPRPLIKTHAYPALAHLTSEHGGLQEWIHQKAHKIYVVRDGRSVLCSLHVFMQSFSPETRCSLSEFLQQQVNGKSRVRAWAEHVKAWADLPDIYVLKFEDLIKKPRQTIASLAESLELMPRYVEPLLPQSPQNIWQGRWARLTQWQPESSAIIGYYNGQKTQQWQEAFKESDRVFFHQEAGDLLLKLGYLTDDTWVNNTVFQPK
ncbi:MAG: sulfotransferase domain-containing protein [Cyanobacteria bacterium P01_E01_bin.6]